MKKIQLQEFPSIFVVADENVKEYAAGLAPGKPLYTITATEEHTHLQTVENICRWLLAQGADRQSLVLAVGGGVTTDIAGFAACIYKRGIRYANVPTTLLAQVDAAIGGKTGVNLDSYKNILGVIRQPEFTYISAEPLRTLPEREFKSGIAEMLKTFIIGDEKLYERAVKLLKGKIETPAGQEELEFLISAAGAIKRRIVKADPYEKGLRRVLNLGHTYAHAIEWYEHTHGATAANPAEPMTHGQAVAAGIIRAAEISESQGWCRHGLAKKLAKDFKSCGLPASLPCRPDLLAEAIAKDKKAENGYINFVLIKEIGTVIVRKLSPAQL